MSAFVGRGVAVYVSYSQDPTVVPNDYVRIGAVRNKEFGPEWDTVDATADDSPNQTRENLVTFKTFNPSLSGIARTEEDRHHDAIEDYVTNPTNDQPYAWIRVERPSKNDTIKTYDIPVILTSFRFTANYDQPTEWSLEAISNGGVTITYV